MKAREQESTSRSKEHALPYKGALEGYVVNFLTRNYWRVQNVMEREEVLQESYLVYLRIAKKYPDVEARHLMALFKTSWGNHFTDLAYIASKVANEVSTPEDVEIGSDFVGDMDNSGFMRVLLLQAPAEIKQVFSLFIHAPTEVYNLFFDVNQREYNRYKNRNNVINSLLGFKKNRDIMGEVKAYFS